MSFNQYSCGFSSNYWPSKGLCHINGRCYASIHYLSPTDGLRIHIEVLAIVLNVGWGNVTYATRNYFGAVIYGCIRVYFGVCACGARLLDTMDTLDFNQKMRHNLVVLYWKGFKSIIIMIFS